MPFFKEGAFEFCDLSHILFVVSAISSREPAFAAFTVVGDGAVVDLLMVLWVLTGVFALGRVLLMI